MIDLTELQAKYPTFKLVSQPLSECVCKGSGERLHPAGFKVVCICVCLSGTEELRLAAVKAFAETVKKIREEN